MKNDILSSLHLLSDAALVAGLKSSLTRERSETANVVAHLAELDTRDVYLREGYTSLFVYCRDALGMSDGEAYNRIEVARAARRFPVVLEMLADGRVHLTAVRLLAPHLTVENHGDMLGSARGKTKLEIQEVVARLSPRPDVAASVRRLPARAEAAPLIVAPGVTAPPVCASVISTPISTPEVSTRAVSRLPTVPLAAPEADPGATIASAPIPHVAVTPLSPQRYKLQLTIGGETLEKMRLAKDMLSHALPTGDDAAILDRAFDALLEKLAKQKFAATDKPRASAGRSLAARTHPRRCNARSGYVTSGVAATSVRAVIGARSAASWSSTTRTRALSVVRRASTSSSCAAGATTTTKAGCTSASAAGAANSFRNELI